MEYITHSPEETEALGAKFALSLHPGDVVAFSGDLGAGKTAFTRGVLRGLGKTVPEIDRRLEHMLVTGMMNAYCEIIIHDMPMEDARRYIEDLGDFYTAGWLKIMGQ